MYCSHIKRDLNLISSIGSYGFMHGRYGIGDNEGAINPSNQLSITIIVL